MADLAIRVRNLGKQYHIGQRERYKALRDTLTDVFYAPFRRLQSAFRGSNPQTPDPSNGTIWALRDVSFEVKHGEVVGIIGRNGAGKSTLLRVLSRITEPTTGYGDLYGRVGSLLEVGTGFHPELTGRDNIYLNGAILGMKKAEIERKFDEIVAFSGVEKFMDTPVKHYSSGMYVRLAFAVAAHLEPEILLVDEVLAVGDAEFQRKCLGKMGEIAKEGRTVLFVSHNMASIQRLCKRGIVLSQGAILVDAPVEKAVSEYLRAGILHREGERTWTDMAHAPGNDAVRLRGIRTKNELGEICSQFDVRDAISVEVDYMVLKEGHQLSAVLEFVDAMGQPLIVSFDNYIQGPWGKQSPSRTGFFRATCFVPGDLFHEGDIMLNLRIFSPPLQPEESWSVREIEILAFTVIDSMDPRGVRGHYPYDWGAPAVRPRLLWQTEHLSAEELGSVENKALGVLR